MTRTLNTIPAEAAPLIKANRSKPSSAKGILAAAATVSFILGLLAATAVTPAPTRAALAFDSQDLGRGQAVAGLAAAAAGAANAQDHNWPRSIPQGENWATCCDDPAIMCFDGVSSPTCVNPSTNVTSPNFTAPAAFCCCQGAEKAPYEVPSIFSQCNGPSEPSHLETLTVGPTYETDKAWKACADCKKGKKYNLSMPLAGSYFDCDPVNFPVPYLKGACLPNCGQKYGKNGTRNITVYIPAAYEDGEEAAFYMEPELTDWFDDSDFLDTFSPQLNYDGTPLDWKNAYPNVMDNLVGTDLPPFVLVAVSLAGPGGDQAFAGDECSDGPGTPRALELVTVSDAYTKFLAHEVLPFVANHPEIKADYPSFKFTDDRDGRVIGGQSNGAGAAFKAVFYEPDLFGTAVALSTALLLNSYELMTDRLHPNQNRAFWAYPPYGEALIQQEPQNRPGRFWLNANQNDSGTPNQCGPPGPGGYLNDILTATNETSIALANKGMDVRFVYGLDACHTDSKVQLEQRVPALIWAMAPWKEKLAAKKSA